MRANYENARRPNEDAAVEQSEATSLLGEFSALLRQVGSPSTDSLTNAPAFFAAYQTNVLAPIEIPAIAAAFRHAASGQCRELLALDSRLSAEPLLQPFADGSRQIGRWQLERLRPLRGERLAGRYLAAIESGQAHGWHTLVYGIFLAIYSLPLRQGLLHYAQETMAGWSCVASASATLDSDALRAVVDRALADSSGASAYNTSIASP